MTNIYTCFEEMSCMQKMVFRKVNRSNNKKVCLNCKVDKTKEYIGNA